MSKHNRRYKDSVFVDLFSEDEKAKENFLALYNALHGTTAVLGGSENVRPCTFLGYKFASELTTAWNKRHPCRF